jgi:8-oxo-dGTP pyrophosphatase MutT (NUDIX family)
MRRGPDLTADDFLAAVEAALRDRPVSVHGDLAAFGAPVPERARPSSVVIPLYEGDEGPGVIVLRKTEGLVPHSGQIAFPGGRKKPDEDELACALRETREEIGLVPEHLELLGRLDSYATVTNYLIAPFVARVRSWPAPLVADPLEVAAILPVPVSRLLAPGTLKIAVRDTPAGPRVVNFFEVGDEVIWGATAAMLRQLLELALGRPLSPHGEPPWDKVRW